MVSYRAPHVHNGNLRRW